MPTIEPPKPARKTVQSLADKDIRHTLDLHNLPEAERARLGTLPDAAMAAADEASRGSGTAAGVGDGTIRYETPPDVESRGSGTWGHLVIRPRNLARGERETARDGADYELVRVLGQGSMGIVYQARQNSINRSVAVKMLASRLAEDLRNREQFLAEAVVTGELAHPNIVPIYDLAINQDGELFYSMKQVKGTPWHERLAANKLAANLDIWMRVADAVAFAHDRGVIHRDLKPENVMLGDFGEVLVMDWGIAVSETMLADPAIRESSGLGGTPAYMAPEMGVDAPLYRLRNSADIYLLGAILYEIVVGHPPHSGRDIWECLQAVIRNKIDPTDKEGELVDIARKAMATDPADRYSDVKQLQAAVREYQSHAESNALVARGDEHLETAGKTGDYSNFQQAILAFREALSLWPENRRAATQYEEARLACAKQALKTGDYDLGLSVLDAEKPEHQPLVRQLQRKRRQRKGVRALVFALIGVIVIGSVVAALWINRERLEADRQRAVALVQKGLADQSAQKAKDAEKVAKQNEQIAKDNEAEAQRQKAIADEQRGIAQEQARLARASEKVARTQEREAKKQQRIAEARREDAAAAAFRSKVGLAASQIEANNFDRAKSELAEIAAASAGADWFDPPPWEYRRMQYMLDLSDQTMDAGFPLSCAAVALDGQTMAVAGESREVLIYTAGQAEPARIETALQQVTDLAFSASGRRLLIACAGQSVDDRGRPAFAGELVVWDLDSGQPARTERLDAGYWILDLAVHGGDDNLLILAGLINKAASPGDTAPDTLRLWQQSSEVLAGHKTPVTAVAISPDGDVLFSVDDLGAGQIWRRKPQGGFELLREKDLVSFLPNDGELATAVRFSPDGTLVATAGRDGSVQLWRRSELIDAPDNAKIQASASLLGHTAAILDANFSQDGRRLVSGGQDGTVRVWDIATADQIGLLRGHSGPVHGCDFLSTEGDRIVSASADNDVRTWSLSGYRETLEIRSDAMPELLYACFSPDGSQVITAHRRDVFFGAAAIWPLRFDGDKPSLDSASPTLFQAGHTQYVTYADICARGQATELVTLANDGLMCLWDAEQGREMLRREGLPRTFTGSGFPLAVTSADGRWILAAAQGAADGGTGKRKDIALLWDRQQLQGPDGSPVATLADDEQSVTAVAISRSGNLLFTGHDRGTGRLWKRSADGNFEPGWKNSDFRTQITGAWFAPDESRVFCVSEYVIRQFDAASGNELARLPNSANVTAAAASADGRRLIVASLDGALTLWDVSQPGAAGGQPLVRLPAVGRNIQSVDITDDGELVLDVGGPNADRDNPDPETNLRLLQVQTGGSLQEKSTIRLPDQRPQAASFYAGDASKVVVTGGYEAVLWDIAQDPPQRLRPFSAPGIPASVRASKDGRCLLMAHEDGTVSAWNAADGRSLWKIQAQREGAVLFACFSPDGQHVFTAGSDGKVILWQADSGQRVRDFCSHASGQAIHHLAFSPDGSLVATASADASVCVWNLQTGQLQATLAGHAQAVLCVAFAPQGRWLASGSADQDVRIWDLQSPADDKTQAVLRGHSKPVGTLAFAPDGGRLVTGSADSTVKLWAIRLASVVPPEESASAGDEAEQSETPAQIPALPPLPTELRVDELMTLKEHRDEVTSVEFSSDGRNLLTASRDGRAILRPTSSAPPPSTPAPQ